MNKLYSRARLGAFLAVFLLLAFPAARTSAEEDFSRQYIIKKEKKLEDLKKRIRAEEQGVKKMSEKERSILGELEDLNRTLVARDDELRGLNASLEKVRAGINRTKRVVGGLEKDLDGLSGRLSSRLAAMYKMRRGEAVQLIFSSDTSAALARRHKYLTIIMDSDTELIAECEGKLSELNAEKKRLVGLKSDLEKSTRAASGKRDEALGIKRKRKTLLANIQREKGRREGIISELNDAAEELTRVLTNLKADQYLPDDAAGFAAMKGRLRMPVEGDIISSYGRVRDPKFKTVTFNNGIVIEAPSGTPVKSVYNGKVVYVGWLKGYGQIMILDHGGGYYTLFAYLSKILKSRGTVVKKGDEIALVGDTGPQAVSALYFEIRQKGVPKDPAPWFASLR